MNLDKIPPLGWAAIAIILIITILINLSLFVMLRNPNRIRKEANQKFTIRRSQNAAETLKKATQFLHDPFAEQNKQLNELSSLVKGLDSPNPPNPPDNTERQDDQKK